MNPAPRPVGFLIWCPEHGLPTVAHPTFLGAVAEADRLKRQYPGHRFVVMSPVEDMSGVGYALGWSRGREEGLAQAHREIMDAEAKTDRLYDLSDDLQGQLLDLKGFRDDAVAYQAIVADALLWFDGFAAAHSPRESWERPRLPDRERLRDLNAAFQRVLPPGPDADQEIPF